MALQVWLPLNGDLHNQGLNQSLTITSANVTFENTGKLGRNPSFNGSSSYIYIPNVTLGNTWSYGCWVYTTTSDSRGWEIVIILNNTGSDADSQLAFWIHQKENRFETLANTQYNSSIPYTNYYGGWHHFFATFNGSTLITYINGIVVNTKSISASQYIGTNLTIGARCTSATGTSFANYFEGKLADFRLYDHALSAKEVKEISQGLVLHYQLNNNNYGNPNLLINYYDLTKWSKESGITVEWDPNANMYKVIDSSHTSSRWGIYQNITLTANTTYTFSIDGKKVDQTASFGFAEGTGWPANTASFTTIKERKSKTITVGEADANCRIYLNLNPVTDGTNYAYFNLPKLELGNIATNWSPNAENLPNIIYDSSGYNNNGKIVNPLDITQETPQYNYATIFTNGAYIKKTDMIFTNSYWTISCWFKKTSSVTNAYETMLGLTKGNGADVNKKFSLYIYNNKIGCVGEKTSNANIKVFDTSLWHHACLVNNNGSFTYYMDGINIKTFSNTNCQTDCTDFVVGGRAAEENAATIGTPWGGNLCDIRLYATALSAEDILNLYKNSKIINGTNKVPRDLD